MFHNRLRLRSIKLSCTKRTSKYTQRPLTAILIRVSGNKLLVVYVHTHRQSFMFQLRLKLWPILRQKLHLYI